MSVQRARRRTWREGEGEMERSQRDLADLALLALEDAPARDMMQDVVEVVSEVMGVGFVSLMEARADRAEFFLRAGNGWREGQAGHRTIPSGIESVVEHVSMAAYAMMSHGPVLVEDLAEDPRFDGCPLMREHGVVSGVMVKVYVGKRLWGVLGAHSAERRRFTDHDGSWLADVARVVGGALARGAAGDVPSPGDPGDADWRDRFAVLQDTMEEIAASARAGARAALTATARVALRELADWCFVDLVEERDSAPGFCAGDVVRRIVVGGDLAADNNGQSAEELSYPLDPGARHGTSKVLRSGEPQLIPRVSDRILQEAANGPGHLGSLRRLDPKSYMVVPLRLAGAVAGALVMVSTDEGRIFGEEELRRAKDLARCASLVLAGRSHAAGLPAGLRAGAGAGTSAVPLGTAELVDVSSAAPRERPPGLQPKALEVLNLLNRGMSNTEAASALYCSESTIRDHLKKAYRALNVKNIQGALARARELGLLDD